MLETPVGGQGTGEKEEKRLREQGAGDLYITFIKGRYLMFVLQTDWDCWCTQSLQPEQTGSNPGYTETLR